MLCEWKKIKIVEAEVCPDHIYMLIEIPPKISVSSFMGYLKGKSSLMIYEQFPELKYKYRNREFWCRGFYVDTTGKNAKKIQEYILGTKGRTSILSYREYVRAGALHSRSAEENCTTENVSSLRSVKVATPPCAACAVIPCGLAVRKQHEMLFAASKFEKTEYRKTDR